MNTFKLSLIAVLTILMGTVSYAQKGSVPKAESYLAKSDFTNAIAEIEMAITIEKNALKSKTWYVRGQIYEAIAKSTDEAVTAIAPDALDKAIESYNKVFEMDKENSSYYQLAKLNMDTMWGFMINNGSNAYGEDDFAGAHAEFEKGLKIKPNDSTTLLYAGAAAQQAEMNDKTLVYYKQMIDLGVASENVFSVVIYLTRMKEENEKALEYTLKAKEAYPNNKTFASEELSLLIVMKKLDEAEAKLIATIKEDPTVINNHLNLAVLYDNLANKLSEEGNGTEAREKWDLAQASYKKVIELDPESYVANYNIGAILVNQAKEYLDQARDMDLKTYQKKGPALEEKAKVYLNDALPYFVKVTEVKSDDIDAHVTLQSIYSTLKMYDEAEAIMNKIDELEAAQGTTGE